MSREEEDEDEDVDVEEAEEEVDCLRRDWKDAMNDSEQYGRANIMRS